MRPIELYRAILNTLFNAGIIERRPINRFVDTKVAMHDLKYLGAPWRRLGAMERIKVIMSHLRYPMSRYHVVFAFEQADSTAVIISYHQIPIVRYTLDGSGNIVTWTDLLTTEVDPMSIIAKHSMCDYGSHRAVEWQNPSNAVLGATPDPLVEIMTSLAASGILREHGLGVWSHHSSDYPRVVLQTESSTTIPDETIEISMDDLMQEYRPMSRDGEWVQYETNQSTARLFNPSHIWTVVECDDDLQAICAGFRHCNSLYYILTAKPHTFREVCYDRIDFG